MTKSAPLRDRSRSRVIRLISVAAFVILAVDSILAQSGPRPEFEVAAVRPNNRCDGPGRGSGGLTSPGRMTLECAQLRDLILTAYGIFANGSTSNPRMQVLGGPAWIDSDSYDVVAKAEGNPPIAQIYGPMLQALLEERFKLKVHRESRQLPVYLLTIANGGAKLRATDGSCNTGVHVCGSQTTGPDGTFEMYGATMANFCIQLGIRLDRDVIDRTGLTGRFDIHLEVSRADLSPRFLAGGRVDQGDSSTPADTTGPSIFTALQEQLGLKLESAKGPVETLVIDNVERPTAN